MYDVIIIGAGMAGLSAAIYVSRAKMKVLIIGIPEKSRLGKAHSIENYLGFPEGISGMELLHKGLAQAQRFGTEFKPGEVVAIKQEDNFVVELANEERHEAIALILATGTSNKTSGIKKESELRGKGVSYCGVCDGLFYGDGKVVVIGNKNFAAKEALEITPFTKDLTIFSNGKEFEIGPELMAELEREGV